MKPHPLGILSLSSVTLLLIHCLAGQVSGEETSPTPNGRHKVAAYGEWCDDSTPCDESNLLSTWNCNPLHTCECPLDRKGLTYEEETKGCAVAAGFKCNSHDPDDKCVTNADCEAGTCTCIAGKACVKAVVPPPPANPPKDFVVERLDRMALGIQVLESSDSNETARGNYPYSLDGIPTISGGKTLLSSGAEIVVLVRVLIEILVIYL